MTEANRIATIWIDICDIFDLTRNETPQTTMKAILDKYSLQEVAETFAAITKYKKHDGRIYGKNREVMEGIPVEPVLIEHSHANPLLETHRLDYIHTAHINQMITELRKEMCA